MMTWVAALVLLASALAVMSVSSGPERIDDGVIAPAMDLRPQALANADRGYVPD